MVGKTFKGLTDALLQRQPPSRPRWPQTESHGGEGCPVRAGSSEPQTRSTQHDGLTARQGHASDTNAVKSGARGPTCLSLRWTAPPTTALWSAQMGRLCLQWTRRRRRRLRRARRAPMTTATETAAPRGCRA
jgi:hypothetical protein